MKIRTEGQTYYPDGLQKVELTDGVSVATSTSTSQGGSDDVPMIYLDYGDKGVYAALEWPTGSMLAKRNGDSIKMSVYFPNFTTRVDGQTALEIPTVYFRNLQRRHRGKEATPLSAGSITQNRPSFSAKIPTSRLPKWICRSVLRSTAWAESNRSNGTTAGGPTQITRLPTAGAETKGDWNAVRDPDIFRP